MRNLFSLLMLTLLTSGKLVGQGVEAEAMASPHAEMPPPMEWIVLQLPQAKVNGKVAPVKAKPFQPPELPGCRPLSYRPAPHVVLYQVEQLPQAESWYQENKDHDSPKADSFSAESALLSWCKKKWPSFNKAAFQAAKTSTPKP